MPTCAASRGPDVGTPLAPRALVRPLVLLLFAAACGRGTHEPERTAMRPRPRVVPTVTADAAPDTERGFRQLADAIAARTGCHVIAWGTAPIADDDAPRRFAVLDPDEGGRGAYLIEDSA